MAANPTATLTPPAAITAVTSARKTLVVTYAVGDALSRLVITVPETPYNDNCVLIGENNFGGAYEFDILEDGEGQRYCLPTGPIGVARYFDTLHIHLNDISPTAQAEAQCVTGIEQLNSTDFEVSTNLHDLDNPVWCGVPGNYEAAYVWSDNAAEGSCYCPPNQQTWHWHAGVYFYQWTSNPVTYAVSVKIEQSVWSAAGIPPDQFWGHAIPVHDNNSAWLDVSGAYALLSPTVAQLRIRPHFDTQGRLDVVYVDETFDEGETWSLHLTYTPDGGPADVAALVAGVTLTGDGYPFQMTATVDNGIDYSTIATGNIRVTGPLGYDEIGTLVSVTPAGDGSPRTATYSVPPPEANLWCWQHNGTYTVSMVANQVADLASNHVAAGTLGTFQCAIAGEPILEPLFLAGYLMAATEDVRFSMRLAGGGAMADNVTPTVEILTTSGSWVAPASAPTNLGKGFYSVTVTRATHFPGYGTMELLAKADGCDPTTETYKAGPIAADQQAIDGDFQASEYNRRDLTIGYGHGVVVDDADYSYDYDYDYDYDYGYGGCTPAITVFCVHGLKLREDSTEVGDTGLYTRGYARRYLRLEYEPQGDEPGESRVVIVLRSMTLGDYTQITVDRAELPDPPPAGTRVTIGGYSAPEQAEA